MINICNWRITVYNKHTYIIIICTYLQRVIAIHAKRYIQLSKTAFLTISPAQVSATSASVWKERQIWNAPNQIHFYLVIGSSPTLWKKNNVKFYNACNLFQIWTAILSFLDHYRYLRPLLEQRWAKQLLQCANLHTKYHITESRESEISSTLMCRNYYQTSIS